MGGDGKYSYNDDGDLSAHKRAITPPSTLQQQMR